MENNDKLSIEDIKKMLLDDMNFNTEINAGKDEDTIKNNDAKAEVENVLDAKPTQKQELPNDNVFMSDSIVDKILDNEEEFVEDVKVNKMGKPKNKTKKQIDKQYKNTYIYGFIFIIVSILLEVANFYKLGLGFLPTCFGIEFAIIIMLAGLIFIIPTEPAKILLMTLLLGVQLAMNLVNASLYKAMYELLTIDMIFTLGGETADSFDWAHVDFISIGLGAIILVLFIALIIIGKKLMPKFKIRRKKIAIVSLLVLLCSVEVLGFSSLKIFELAYFPNSQTVQLVDNNEYHYNNMTSVKYASLKKFGFWSHYINSAYKYLSQQNDISKEEYQKLNAFVEYGDNFSYHGSVYDGNNVSGSLAGDNLIVIMTESGEWFAIDPFNTPNLYDFVENYSVSFTNFYGRNKTNVSEQISLIGSSLSSESLATINKRVGINTPNSLPNIFKSNGYESVNFFHDYIGSFYQRDVINKKLGFSNVYDMEQSSVADKSQYLGDFLDDGEFIESLKNEFMPNDKSFYSHFTTVSTHGPFDKSNSRYEQYYNVFENNYDDYCEYVKNNNLNYVTPDRGTAEYEILKEYKSKAMALENAINVILNHLKTTTGKDGKPLYDNTSIVMFSDHNAFYSDLSYIIKDIDQYANDKMNYNIPFTIFNKSLKAGKVNTFCNTLDIYPTICDLYGFEFNKNLLQGYSVFSNEIENSICVSIMSGIFDDNFFTVTLDDYTQQNNLIDINTKLNLFKQKISAYLEKQEYIEQYYRINYERYIV